MKKTAYRKDILRTITHGKKRFCSILIITALGVITLTGLRAACVDLRKSADAFFDEQNLYDIMIQSTLGLTDEDVETLAALEGVSAAEGGYSETVNLSGDSHKSVLIKTISPTGMSEPRVTEGTLPTGTDEIAVTQAYISDTGKSIGDTLTIEEITDEDEEEDSSEDPIEDSASDDDETEDDDSISIDIDIDTSALEEEEETPTFASTEFTITAIVIDPADINNPDGSTSFRVSSTTDYTFFVSPDAVDSDIYTAVYLTVGEALDLNCFSEEYEAAVSEVIDEIETTVKESREEARTSAVTAEAQEKIDDAENTMNEAFAEVDEQIAEAQEELADARTELDDGWAEIEDGLAEIEDGQAEIDDGWDTLAEEEQNAADQIEEARISMASADRQLTSAFAELEENEALIEESQAQLDEGKEELEQTQAETEAQLEAAKDTLAESRAELEDTLDELEAQLETAMAALPVWPEEEFDAMRSASAAGEDTTEASAALTAALEEALSPYMEMLQEETEELESMTSLLTSLPQLAIGLGQIDAGLSQIEEAEAELAENEAEAEAQFEAAWAEIEESQAQLDEAAAELAAGREELEAAQAQLDAGEKELNEQEALAQQEFADARVDLYEAQQELDEGLQEIYDGIEELEDGEEEYADGLAELEEGIATYESERADAEEKLADAKEELADLEAAVWYVQDRNSLSGYANIDSDSDAIEAIGTAFPVVFLAVAILISLTTVTRMVDEERGLIGTYKALGFTDREILAKYLIFASAACLCGSVLGEIGGFILLPEIVFIIFGVMYNLPEFVLTFDPVYGSLGPVLFLAGIGFATYFACRAALRQTPAILMRPKSPRAGSKVFLEHLPFIWKRFSFLNKVTARNLFRYKKRLFMTVAGILGCTALLVCGFAIKDTVTDLMPRQYGEVYKYDLLVVADDNDELLETMDSSAEVVNYLNVHIDSVYIETDSGRMTVQLIVVPDDDAVTLSSYITLEDIDGNSVLPDENGILVTRNAGQMIGFFSGDTVSVQDLTLTQADLTVTALLQNYLGNCIYMTQSVYEEYFDEYEANGVLATLDESLEDPVSWADELSHSDGITSATATQQLKDEFSQAFVLINMVVYIIIILAAALAFVVLFTLSNTNISEREREIATIKVLGFFDHEVHLYVNKETLILTILGILPGFPVGSLLGHAMTTVLNMPSLYFAVSIHPVSYAYSGGLALLFALIVQQITNRVLNHINPVEALKSIE